MVRHDKLESDVRRGRGLAKMKRLHCFLSLSGSFAPLQWDSVWAFFSFFLFFWTFKKRCAPVENFRQRLVFMSSSLIIWSCSGFLWHRCCSRTQWQCTKDFQYIYFNWNGLFSSSSMSNLALEVKQVSAWLKASSHTVREFLLSVWNLLGINDQLSHYAGSQYKTGLARFKWLHLYMILVLLQDIWARPGDPGGGRTWMDECGNLRYANFVWLIYEVTVGKCFFFPRPLFFFLTFLFP